MITDQQYDLLLLVAKNHVIEIPIKLLEPDTNTYALKKLGYLTVNTNNSHIYMRLTSKGLEYIYDIIQRRFVSIKRTH